MMRIKIEKKYNSLIELRFHINFDDSEKFSTYFLNRWLHDFKLNKLILHWFNYSCTFKKIVYIDHN